MANIRTISNAFNSGEWSPLMEGRSDLAKYRNAAKTIENFMCLKQGGVTRRPGTHFAAEVKDSTNKTILIAFVFSEDQVYIMELGNLYGRVYKNGARIESPPGTPVEFVTPYLTADLFDLHFCQSADVIYVAHSSHAPRQIARTSDTSWTCTAFPYLNASDVVAGGGAPFLPLRIDVMLTPSGVGPGPVTITASSPIFDVAMTKVDGVAGLGKILWRLTQGGVDTLFEVTAFIDASNLTATPVTVFPSTAASSSFEEAAWSDFRGYPSCVTLFQQRLWWAGSTFQPDTLWGSQTSDYTNYSPGTALDNEACTFTLASNKINIIRWLAPSRSFLVGTSGQEWQTRGDALENPITPSSVDAIPETTYGSDNVSPVQVSYATLFLQRHARRLREYTYNFTTDAYDAPDMTILAEHISLGGFTQMDYQQELDSIVWCVRADGTLCGLTYERPQDVVAWHRQVTNGRFESVAVIPNPNADEDQVWVIVNRTIGGVTKRYVEYLDTQGGYYGKLGVDCGLTYPPSTTNIISISTAEFTLPGPPISVNTRVTYYAPGHGLSPAGTVVIAGTNPSAFSGSFTVETTPDEDHFTIVFAGADMPVSGTGGSFPPIGATSTLTGLSHLEGQMVDILGNGAVYASQIVTGGQVTGLSPQVTRAEVGLHFDSTLLTMRPEAGGDNGETAQGGRKRFSSVIVRLDSSIGVTINEEQVELRTPDDPMDGPVPLFTGDVKAANLGWDTDARIMVKQTQPLPLTVLCIIGDLDVNES